MKIIVRPDLNVVLQAALYTTEEDCIYAFKFYLQSLQMALAEVDRWQFFIWVCFCTLIIWIKVFLKKDGVGSESWQLIKNVKVCLCFFYGLWSKIDNRLLRPYSFWFRCPPLLISFTKIDTVQLLQSRSFCDRSDSLRHSIQPKRMILLRLQFWADLQEQSIRDNI